MRQAIAVTPQSVERLVKQSRLFSYISSSLTKTYCDIEGNNFVLYFKGPKSVLSFGLVLEEPVKTPACFSIDINKLLSAIKKVGNSGESLKIHLSDNPSNITLYSNLTQDKITFSVIYYDRATAEITSLLSFFADKSSQFTGDTLFTITQEVLDFASVTSTFMATMNKNNSIAATQNKLMYADRTIIVSMNTKVCDSPLDVKIHRFILGFIEFVIEESAVLEFSSDKNFVRWKSSIDPFFQAILAIDPCIISIPDPSDLAAIVPEEGKCVTMEISPASLLTSIDFFSGLFEASVWKPITFTWTNAAPGQQKMMLTYRHPSTEVDKEPANYRLSGDLVSPEASFTLISDSAKTLLAKMDPSGRVEMSFNDAAPDEAHGAGIALKYFAKGQTAPLFEAVLAKLTE